MRKQAKYTYQKINQDTSKSKHSNTFYWDAKNIRVLTNEEFGAVTNQKGNELIKTLPIIESDPTNKKLDNVAFPINDLKIIHSEKIDEKVVLFSTNSISDERFSGGIEAIWLLEETRKDVFNIKLLYLDKLGFNEDSHLESVGINENEESQKVYWVDGENEVRFINIKDTNLINKEPSEISVTPRATLLDPEVIGYSSGGSHKAGVIQYAYNLYNKYGAQTKISGLSELVALQNDDKGNPLDAPINKSPNVKIDNIPQNFEYIKVYSVYYSSLGQTPRISLIYENDNTSESLEITDTNDIIQEVSLNEFNIIGTQSIIPKHITNKDGHLFFGDYKTKKFDVEDYDARAFSFAESRNTAGLYTVNLKHDSDKYNTIFIDDISNPSEIPDIPIDHDCINETNGAKFNLNGNPGASGKNVNIEIKYKDNDINTPDTSSLNTSLKRGETYRIGVVFYNDKDEESFVKWITDIKIPTDENVLNGDNARLAYLEVELNNLPESVKSYRLVKVKRLEKDKTIKAQGIINDTIVEFSNDGRKIIPDYFIRTFRRLEEPSELFVGSDLLGNKRFDKPIRFQRSRNSLFTVSSNTFDNQNGNLSNNLGSVTDNINDIISGEIGNTSNLYITNTTEFNFYTPSILKNKNNLSISNNDSIRLVGFSVNDYSISNIKIFALPFTLFNSSYRNTTGNGGTGTITNRDEDAEIDIRTSFKYNTLDRNEDFRSEIYLFQSDLTTSKPFYQNLNLPSSIIQSRDNFVYFINPSLPTFETDFSDGSKIEFNVWEFKKSFYRRNFTNITLPPNNQNSNVQEEVNYVVNALDYLIANVNVQKDIYDGTIPLTKEPTEYSNNFDIGEFKSSHIDSIYFNSLDLYENLVNSFDSIPDTTKQSKDYIPIVEFYNDDITQYGGKTYTARQRNQYIPLSKKRLSISNQVDSIYGDTYIQRQDILRVNEVQTIDSNFKGTMNEVVSYISEIDFNNDLRHDNLKNQIGNSTINLEDSFLYNEVYSQENDLIKSISKPFNFSIQEVFKSEVIASPKKILGEFIDNWTTISINDRITLDTKYGEITGFAKLNDTLYTFQRNGIAYLAINPRVQLQASDNISIQVGSGKLIERYQYINTESGTLHPRSITATESGIFYFDTLNYSINRLTGNKEEISLTKGLYNYIKDFSVNNFDDLFPITRVVTHYDNKNEEVYFTFNTGEDAFTVAYNLLADGFVSFYDFIPNVYFNINNGMYTVPSDNTVWQHDIGDYSTFYNTYYPSSITLLFNEDADYDKVLDNLSFITNVTEDGDDKVNITFNDIKVDNSYQSTDVVPLQIGKNLRRKFREFHITIPRQSGTRNRIRGEYALIKLIFDYPANNYKLVLNDSIVSYTLS